MERRTILALILATATITYALRAVPMVLFRRPFSNPRLAAFLDALPYALLSAMIIPEIFYAVGDSAYPGVPRLPSVAGAVTALALGYAGKSLPSVALVATAVAYAAELIIG